MFYTTLPYIKAQTLFRYSVIHSPNTLISASHIQSRFKILLGTILIKSLTRQSFGITIGILKAVLKDTGNQRGHGSSRFG